MLMCFHCKTGVGNNEIRGTCLKRNEGFQGKKKRHQFLQVCSECSTRFLISGYEMPRIVCSRKCSDLKRSRDFSGTGNPNYGNKVSKHTKKLISKQVSLRMLNPRERWGAGTANRGRVFGNVWLQRLSEGHKGISHRCSEKSKRKIGTKSREKFTDEYRKRVRKVNEEHGNWTPLENLSDFALYRKLSNWVNGANLLQFQPIETKRRVSELGIFHPVKNKTGLVRDHRLSRKQAYALGVFPEIVRHPANCRYVTHSENCRKRVTSDLSVKELFSLISKFSREWTEQGQCIELIERYELGERYRRVS